MNGAHTVPAPGLHGARVLLGVSGGIAAYKAAELARLYVHAGAEVQPILTAGARSLVAPATFAALTGRHVPESLWSDPAAVEHVAQARWGQVLVVAPATAHVLAKLAAGLADDLLTSVALAFAGPTVVAPAMHTEMWEHAATRANVELLRQRGVQVVPPAVGALTSGDTGVGRLAELADIVMATEQALGAGEQTLRGVRVLVTAGGTHEPLDPVRYLGNRSSGRMGAALVAEALRRGASVTAVAAPMRVDLPAGARTLRVETAQELRDVVVAEAPDHDVLVLAAAVADFRPKLAAATKLRKQDGVPEIVLEPTPDALAELGESRRSDQVLVGFAAETDDHLRSGRRKLESKHLDLLLLNHVESGRSAFGAESATAYVLDGQSDEPLGAASKAVIAARLLDRVETVLRSRGLLPGLSGVG